MKKRSELVAVYNWCTACADPSKHQNGSRCDKLISLYESFIKFAISTPLPRCACQSPGRGAAWDRMVVNRTLLNRSPNRFNVAAYFCFSHVLRSAVVWLQMVTRTKKVFVGGLSSTTSVEDVKEYFSQFGKVSYQPWWRWFENLASWSRLENVSDAEKFECTIAKREEVLPRRLRCWQMIAWKLDD
jgi:hypothetical protein